MDNGVKALGVKMGAPWYQLKDRPNLKHQANSMQGRKLTRERDQILTAIHYACYPAFVFFADKCRNTV
jgi:hypothetical protein